MASRYQLTKEHKDLIHQMFFGPFKDEWRDEKGFVDNRDDVIAKRLGVSLKAVSHQIEFQLNSHFSKLVHLEVQICKHCGNVLNPLHEEQV